MRRPRVGLEETLGPESESPLAPLSLGLSNRGGGRERQVLPRIPYSDSGSLREFLLGSSRLEPALPFGL